MIKHILTLLSAGICMFSTHAQNKFPATGNTGIGTSSPEALLHIRTGGTAAYPSTANRGNVQQLFQADNNGLEIGIANGINTRKAWILARHITVPEHGQHYSTLHLQPSIDDMSFYRGVSIGFPATSDMTFGVGLVVAGNVGIGTRAPGEALSVNGKIRAHEVKVETTNWPDYVFKPEYILPSLAETESFIQGNGHLPEMPKASEVESEGIPLGKMNTLLLKKVEELTLHLINQDKEMQDLKRQLRAAGIVK